MLNGDGMRMSSGKCRVHHLIAQTASIALTLEYEDEIDRLNDDALHCASTPTVIGLKAAKTSLVTLAECFGDFIDH